MNMKTTQLTISFDAEKLSALRHYAAKKQVSIEAELIGAIDRLYEKLAPAAVREYIESRSNTPSPARLTRPAQSTGKAAKPSGGQ